MAIKMWPKDAKSVGEKVLYTTMYVVPAAFYLFMVLSAFQVFHNFYSEACRDAGFWWVAGLFTGVLGVRGFFMLAVSGTATKGQIALALAFIVLSLFAFTGFNL